ncbi:MAG TPA: hypothetical protein VNE58_09425 [Casimicrobiaceae bacterium]|nr:hypothetical protein [Casimicrobiaceae bacterium]
MTTRPLGTGRVLLVLVAFAAIAAVIGWETGWGQQVAPQPATTPVPAAQPVPLALLPDYQIDGGTAGRRDTIERPAFVPTRRPPPVITVEAPKPKMPRGQFMLTGTAVVDQKQIAFLRETSGGRARTVRAGEVVNGVTVAEIKADRVRFTMGDESEELLLKVAAGPRQTIQPPQPPQPAVPGAPVPPGMQQPPVVPTPSVAAGALPPDSDAAILERRRAARAQQAAQEAQARAQAGQAASQVPAAPSTAPQPTPPPAPATTTPDPGWAEVYRRMQQPRR